MTNKTAYIFPAFITDFTGKEISFLEENKININDYLATISKEIGINLPEFSYELELFKEELNSQFLAYSFSCVISDVLKSKGILPDYISGYSMGIYASLYAAGSISFETGVKLIFNAYNLVKEISQKRTYGMGAIIGLTFDDVSGLISQAKLDLEIININNEHSLVIAGKKSEVDILLSSAKEEGALSVSELTVNTPYHSKHLLNFSESFKSFVKQIELNDVNIPVISTYNQREMKYADDLRSELVLNLTEKINWYKTMQKLIELGVNTMYECGAGKDLKKISRFIEGDYRISSIYKKQSFID